MRHVTFAIEPELSYGTVGTWTITYLKDTMKQRWQINLMGIPQPAALEAPGDYYIIRSEDKKYFAIVLLPEDVGVMAKLAWGGQ